jgi:hypothetical protein
LRFVECFLCQNCKNPLLSNYMAAGSTNPRCVSNESLCDSSPYAGASSRYQRRFAVESHSGLTFSCIWDQVPHHADVTA